jgi:hypothetical protein
MPNRLKGNAGEVESGHAQFLQVRIHNDQLRSAQSFMVEPSVEIYARDL